MIFVSTLPGPERNASPVGECNAGSINCCTVYATSSAEKGVLSENETPLRSLSVICLPSFDTFHDCANSGSNACVCRFRRTSTPPVKYRIATEASSSTFSGSNVFGSERRQQRSSPCPIAEAARIPRQRIETAIVFLATVLITANPSRKSVMPTLPLASKAQVETMSPQQPTAKAAQTSKVPRLLIRVLPIPSTDFPMKALAQPRPIPESPDSPRSK